MTVTGTMPTRQLCKFGRTRAFTCAIAHVGPAAVIFTTPQLYVTLTRNPLKTSHGGPEEAFGIWERALGMGGAGGGSKVGG